MITLLKWNELTTTERKKALTRPSFVLNEEISIKVKEILSQVKIAGDAAINYYTKLFDHVELDEVYVNEKEMREARNKISAKELQALEFAYEQIFTFHQTQVVHYPQTQVSADVDCTRQRRAINQVGLYVPGGSTPLPSTVLMLGIPALIAGCKQRIMCTPPQRDGSVDPYLLVAAQLCGISKIYKIGGAQAIAAMGYGTQSVAVVNKIFGPGNIWVTAAKLALMTDMQGAHCDLPAGPSELVIIADETANAEFVAADLLAQAEHDPNAQVLLITDSKILANDVLKQITLQIATLSRSQIIEQALTSAKIILMQNIADAFAISNEYAPEHLSLQIRDEEKWLSMIENAGSVFIGSLCAQTLGDYVIGTNHVLPTYGFSKVYSGLSTTDFIKYINFARLGAQGLKKIGPKAITLADIERLDAHQNSIAIRLESLR